MQKRLMQEEGNRSSAAIRRRAVIIFQRTISAGRWSHLAEREIGYLGSKVSEANPRVIDHSGGAAKYVVPAGSTEKKGGGMAKCSGRGNFCYEADVTTASQS